MAGIAAAILGAGTIGAVANYFGARQQTKVAQQAIQQQQQMFDVARGAAQPFITAGTGAAGTLSDLLKPGADMSKLLMNIPGMDFIQRLAQMGVTNQATATGLTGGTLLAGANAATNIGLSQGWIPIVNALQGLVTTGQGAAAGLGGQAVQTGANIGGQLTNIGQAQAGAATGAAGAIGNAAVTASLAPLITSLLQGQGGALTNRGSMYGANVINLAGGGQIPLPPTQTV